MGKKDDELKSFVQEFGHARVPGKFPQNPSLGGWVFNQRKSYKGHLKGDPSSSMTADRIRRLNKVGFEWECYKNQSWERSYEEIVNFVQEFGHTKVPQKFPQNPSLGGWVFNQRKSYKGHLKGDPSSSMTADRIRRLNKVGFEWECYKNQSWERSYDEIVNFVQEFGHTKVPQKFPQNPSLGGWVFNQRKSYKGHLKGFVNIDENRIQLLKNVNAEPEGRRLQPWERRYEELLSFVKGFGHAKVPQKFPQNPSLGTWVFNQRQSYKRYLKGDSSSKMTADRILRLNKVCFEWECRHRQPWERSYEELVSFVQEFGHARVSRKIPQNPSLGAWVYTQRQSYQKYLKDDSSSNMTANRIHLLNKIGFEWVLRG
eukprot:CAMPEP_0194392996 /NCGR_PEP_ID=MMETSP0174-20130528/123050_1 /TAXON_ID=216777 /ORGANISM="Proboscia alata, Strain PI-D3" /LENGTH=370 /DNA_ID=CAMNT_0039188627 /DNA_START=594 /DNA_END=1704 /DNA_ORIENTATION=+